MDLTKTIIIGNSGSGKSWLAERIAARSHAKWIDLDLIYWEAGGFQVPRNREDTMALVREAANADRWVVEGIYGQLVQAIATFATTLIWLDVAESECAANIEQRGMRRGGTEKRFAELQQWAAGYRTRSGSSSHAAHHSIFNGFDGAKACLFDRNEVTAFASFIGENPRSYLPPGTS